MYTTFHSFISEKIRNSKLYKELLVYDKIKDIKTEIGLKSETVQVSFIIKSNATLQDYCVGLIIFNQSLFNNSSINAYQSLC